LEQAVARPRSFVCLSGRDCARSGALGGSPRTRPTGGRARSGRFGEERGLRGVTAAATPEELSGRAYLRLVALGALIGIPAALVAAGFLALVHELEDVLWHDLPDQLGYSSPPWYLVLGLPMLGACLVVAARSLLPGDGGHSPLEGLSAKPTPFAWGPGVAACGPWHPRVRLRARPRGSSHCARVCRRHGGVISSQARPAGERRARHGRFVLCDIGALRGTAGGRHAAGRGGRRHGGRADPQPAARPRGGGLWLPDLRRPGRLGRARHNRAGRARPAGVQRDQHRGPARWAGRRHRGRGFDRRRASAGRRCRPPPRAAPRDARPPDRRRPGGGGAGRARGRARSELPGRALLRAGFGARAGGGRVNEDRPRPAGREGAGVRDQPRLRLPRRTRLPGGLPRCRARHPCRQPVRRVSDPRRGRRDSRGDGGGDPVAVRLAAVRGASRGDPGPRRHPGRGVRRRRGLANPDRLDRRLGP
jgi:hypothetical protein